MGGGEPLVIITGVIWLGNAIGMLEHLGKQGLVILRENIMRVFVIIQALAVAKEFPLDELLDRETPWD